MAGMGIRVTPEQLQQVSARLDAGAAGIEGTLWELAANVAPLGSDWAGVAQTRSSTCGPSGSPLDWYWRPSGGISLVGLPTFAVPGLQMVGG
jgi:hypothetical protein